MKYLVEFSSEDICFWSIFVVGSVWLQLQSLSSYLEQCSFNALWYTFCLFPDFLHRLSHREPSWVSQHWSIKTWTHYFPFPLWKISLLPESCCEQCYLHCKPHKGTLCLWDKKEKYFTPPWCGLHSFISHLLTRIK